ncbi:adenylosuccinate synthetase [Paucihalobacter ruber]|uniref:Adenylosuccinate synthetase n=1 Tax=Paucihalobacter ruber TaxID=2567861 RepID=A0A506PRP0_9FLAO|nr:adenylosuccinate synthetase [Paucihalobacter ruber]
MLNELYPFLIQLPIGIRNPDDNNPVDFTKPFNVIVYIILLVEVIILYILWKKQKKDKN